MIHHIVIGYLFLLNMLAFILFGTDKQKAKRNKWRISEPRLLLLAILGGSLGIWTGMYFFHHKIRHPKFTLGIPFIFIFQVLILLYLVNPLV